MAFAYILRNRDESILTVNLTELNINISQDFENSLEKENPSFINWWKGFDLVTKVMMVMRNK